jgi:hypothetical protein
MTPPPDQETIDRWHRWFAVECNNRGWDLVAQAQRTPAETAEMVSAAYAAAFHWSKVGGLINGARAAGLLSAVHAATGNGPEALRQGRLYLEFCESNPHEDWDFAFAHAAVAMAGAVLGDKTLHRLHYQAAVEEGEKIQGEEDKKIFFSEFARVPIP